MLTLFAMQAHRLRQGIPEPNRSRSGSARAVQGGKGQPQGLLVDHQAVEHRPRRGSQELLGEHEGAADRLP